MELSKAIEVGKQYRRDGEFHDPQDFRDFVDLGIEALERFQTMRQDPGARGFWPLPGEAEE